MRTKHVRVAVQQLGEPCAPGRAHAADEKTAVSSAQRNAGELGLDLLEIVPKEVIGNLNDLLGNIGHPAGDSLFQGSQNKPRRPAIPPQAALASAPRSPASSPAPAPQSTRTS